jgi:3-oxoacyl-[acyl-carrier-protein] synthase-3
LALDEAVRAGKIKPNDLLLMLAFGGGLTWAASLIRW